MGSKTDDTAGPVPAERQKEFLELFKRSSSEYLRTGKGKKHLVDYQASRKVAQQNYDAILAADGRGEDTTDRVLLKLLPYNDWETNRETGAWICPAPAINKDIKTWFENAGWRKAGDWPEVSRLILTFVRRCVETPGQVATACEEFSRSAFSKGLQTGMLTPILNALRPDDFCIVNNKSRLMINYFTGKSFGPVLTDYPDANRTALAMAVQLGPEIREIAGADSPMCDLLDAFSHWLVGIEKYPPVV